MAETIELDFSDVQEFAPIAKGVPKGNYLFKVKKIEASTSKQNNPMWVVDAEFVDGPWAGQTIREYMALTPAALFKVKSFLEAIGLNVGKKKVKLPNDTATLQKKFGGKVYGGHVDDGDPYTDNNGNPQINSEIKYHLKASEVQGQSDGQAAAAEATTPEPEPDEAPAEEESTTPQDAPEGEEAPTDTAEELEEFDLDGL